MGANCAPLVADLFLFCYERDFMLSLSEDNPSAVIEAFNSTSLRARVGRPQTSSSPPVIFIAGRPKAALLFWFFGDFRCGALLFMVIHVIYKYKNK